jgi:hypothetical protein
MGQIGSSTMLEATPQSTFHGLPLTPERDAEVRALHKEENAAWAPRDTPELEAMLDDMLVPPSDEDGGSDAKRSTKRMRPRSARQLPSTRP